jgi:orotidine-5'-phosphate decarboxylase
MQSKLIVALDYNNQNEAFKLVDQLDPQKCGLKVGSELFTCAGVQCVRSLIERGFRIFLDLKFHDIPTTVANSCKAAADMGVWMLNVHALGGFNMMQTAKVALESYGKDSPILIAVTILTSFKQDELCSVGINKPLLEQVKSLARLAKDSGLNGVVSSAHEVNDIKLLCGQEFITVTPGIRPADNSKNDQSRTMTPKQALDEGSDFLVIGRPITRSPDPSAALSKILDEL